MVKAEISGVNPNIKYLFLTLLQEQRLTSSLVTVLVNAWWDFIAYTCLRNATNVDKVDWNAKMTMPR